MSGPSGIPAFLDRPPGAPVAVKICGVTRPGDADVAVAAGADAVGINFWPGSRRFLAPDEAFRWLPALEGRVSRVAVVVDASRDEIERLWATGLLEAVQLHGDEPDELVGGLVEDGIAVIRALRVTGEDAISRIAGWPAVGVLLDAFRPGEYGGTGATFDWALARAAVERFPDRPILVAGGLTPDNVADAVARVRPAGVDTAGGVERAPGIKDAEAVAKFVSAARA